MKNKQIDIIKEISDRELLFHLYATQIVLLTISFILGIILFDSFSSFFDIFDWKDERILWIGGGAGIGIVIFDVILMKTLPPSYYDDGGINERIFGGRSLPQIFFLALIVAVSEEILFRGIIQTHTGLIISSLIFAVVHYRYLFNWFLFVNITALSFLIGYIYSITENLAVTIFMHFLIDFLLGIVINYKKKNTMPLEQEGIFNE